MVKGTKCATVSESNICVSYNLTDYERITNQQKSIQISKSQKARLNVTTNYDEIFRTAAIKETGERENNLVDIRDLVRLYINRYTKNPYLC